MDILLSHLESKILSAPPFLHFIIAVDIHPKVGLGYKKRGRGAENRSTAKQPRKASPSPPVGAGYYIVARKSFDIPQNAASKGSNYTHSQNVGRGNQL